MVNEIETVLIRNINAALARLGWDAKDLARETKLSLSGIYKILKAERWPSPDNLLRIQKALKLSTAELFVGDKKEPQEDLRNLLAVLPALNDSQVRRYLDAMRRELAAASGDLHLFEKPKNKTEKLR